MSNNIHSNSDRILRLPAVETKVGLSRSSIYVQIEEGTFPRPVLISKRAVGWRESTIDAWIESKMEVQNNG